MRWRPDCSIGLPRAADLHLAGLDLVSLRNGQEAFPNHRLSGVAPVSQRGHSTNSAFLSLHGTREAIENPIKTGD